MTNSPSKTEIFFFFFSLLYGALPLLAKEIFAALMFYCCDLFLILSKQDKSVAEHQ